MTGYKGVCFIESLQKYRAYINKDGKQHNLGLFYKKEDAAEAYNRAATELFGEYARLNEIVA